MYINKNLKGTVFNYCTQWSGVHDHEIDGSIISMGAIKKKAPTKINDSHKEECTGGDFCGSFPMLFPKAPACCCKKLELFFAVLYFYIYELKNCASDF